MKITRDKIIKKLHDGLIKNQSVFAFWIEGADALNTTDKYSDLDIWLDVEDSFEDKVLREIQSILSQINSLDFEYEIDHPHPKIKQAFFHLKNTSEFFIIDVCIQSHSRGIFLTKGKKDEEIKVIFDRKKIIKFKELDKADFKKLLAKRIKKLNETFLFFQAWVKKGVNRNNFLEALNYYYSFVLEPLVELLRIKYEPTKYNFGLKHIERDLPNDMLSEIEDLYKISSINEITVKMKKANKLFSKIIFEL